MSIRRKAALSLVLVTSVTTPVLADVPFDQMVVFGVSYEDIGQFPDYDFVAGFLPALVPPPGAGLDGSTGLRLTNIDPTTGQRGRAWVELLATDLGIGALSPSTPLLFPGDRTDIPHTQNINFAYAGARAEDVLDSVIGESRVTHPLDGLVPDDLSTASPGLLQRLASGELRISPRTLFVVNSGGNDVRDATIDDPAAAAIRAAAMTLQTIHALVDAGAQTIVVPTFPPLGLLSESDNVAPDGGRTPKAEARNIAAETFNKVVARGLPATGGNIVTVDFDNLFLEVLADPAAFGFDGRIDHSRYCFSSSEWSISGINCTEAPGLGISSGGKPDDFMLNDGLHPTQPMNRILGDYTEAVLRAPGMIALLPQVVLGDARAFQNTIRDYQVRRRWIEQPSGVDFFASVQGGETDLEAPFAAPGVSSEATDLTVGLGVGINDTWFLGGAIGFRQSDVDIDRQGSQFDASGLLGTLFVGYRHGIWFGDFSLTAGKTDLQEIERVVQLGSTMVRREQGETDADTVGLSSEIGVDLMPADLKLRFGPFIHLGYLEVEVDGYAERDAKSTTMVFGDQTRESLVGSAGVFASYPFRLGGVETEVFGDISYRKEFEDNADDVKAVVKNLQSGVHFHMPGYEIADESVVVHAGISARLGDLRLGLFGGYEGGSSETTFLGLNIAYDL